MNRTSQVRAAAITKATAHNNSLPNSESRSASQNYSGVDYGAIGLTDDRYREALGLTGDLGDRLGNLYGDRLKRYMGLMNGAVSGVQGLGQADRARIERDSKSARNSVGQSVAGSGLYNSTVKQTMEQGVDRNRNEAMGQLDEGLRQALLNILLQRASGADAILAQKGAALENVGLAGTSLLGQRASALPTKSEGFSTSSSQSRRV